MTFDDLSSTWQQQNERPLSPEEREAMVARICRRVERVGGTIFRRDLIETVVGVALVFFFGRMVFYFDDLISKSGAGFLVIWILFIIWRLHRTRTIQRPAPIDAPVREFCRIERDRLERQIQLLRSVLWWYIAPIIVGANVVYIGTNGLGRQSLFYAFLTGLMAWGVYLANRAAASSGLVPLRDEVSNVLGQLEGAPSDTVQAVGGMAERGPKRRDRLLGITCAAATAVWAVAFACFDSQEVEYPRRAPYSGIRWEAGEPVVKIGEEWVTLVSLDGIAVRDIVAFSQRRYLLRWKKRFEEDLVEVLTRMGHAPGDTVRLVVRPPGSSETRTLDDVPMTEANRQALYRAARDRE